MSRAAVTKSRADKSKGAAAVAIAHEIIPGKFTDQDWNRMLEFEDGAEFASDLVDEVVDGALSFLYDQYIQDQLLPFTISQAKDAILQIVDWQYLLRDELETDLIEDLTWQEDEEPLPAITDCWAQGIVPRQALTVTPAPTPEPTIVEVGQEQESEIVEEQPEQEDEVCAEEDRIKDGVGETQEEGEGEGTGSEQSTGEQALEEQPTVISEKTHVKIEEKQPHPPTCETKPKRKFKPYKGRLKSAGLGNMTESLLDTEIKMAEAYQKLHQQKVAGSPDAPPLFGMPASCQSILKLQAGRPPGNKDVLYDDHGNVLAVVKFNPAKLPSHCVKTGFKIVDPDVEAAQARLEAMRTGRYVAPGQKNKAKTSSLISKARGTPSSDRELEIPNALKSVVTALPPPMIETMEVSPGVVVKEGVRVKRGPRQYVDSGPRANEDGLREVVPDGDRPMYSAAEILDAQTPVLRLLRDSPIIPPISTGLA